MPDIKFYHNAPNRLQAACSITAKAVARNMRVTVYAPDKAIAQRYNSMLWSFQPVSFVPHVMASSPYAGRTPTVIVERLSDAPHQDVLLNLDDSLPPEADNFRMIIEVVPQDDEARANARRRWQGYKARGYTIEAHDLANIEGSQAR